MATSKSLKTAVKKEVKEADAKTGNVSTTKVPADPPTGARSHPPEGFLR